MLTENCFFEKLTDFLQQEVAPLANRIDEEEVLFREVYERFLLLGGLHLLIPRAFGGLGGERQEWIEYNILISQYSGALLFLQAQHQFCISVLKKLLPHPKIEFFLQSLVLSNRGVALALQKNRNLLHVEKTKEGYRLCGKLLWVTGYRFFPHVLISFEDQGILFYALIPFAQENKNNGSIHLSAKIETVVFNAVPSHSIFLDHWLVLEEELLAAHPLLPKTLREHPNIYTLAGVSKALLHLALEGQYGSTPEVMAAHRILKAEWSTYYQHILQGKDDPLLMRVEGLRIAQEAALLARFAAGAASVFKDHPINRLTREIWQYSLAGYSEDQRNAYLQQRWTKQRESVFET